MAHWSSKYIEIEYKKMNCSKFVEHVLRDHFKIDRHFPAASGNSFEQSNLIRKSLPLFCEKTDRPVDGSLVLMSGNRSLSHVGIFCEIRGVKYVLHTESTLTTAILHRIADLPSFGYTLEGFYKWL